jgi:hypothetical protein
VLVLVVALELLLGLELLAALLALVLVHGFSSLVMDAG